VADRTIRVEQFEINLTLGEIHTAQPHPHGVAHLPAPS
jgi:hypothetical protein